ncbi:MAG: hypothetical protein JWN08_651 [Frankiales bacterium]|nr:hypothetical protein [Frankiales bacterium]
MSAPTPVLRVDPAVTAACARLLDALPDELDPGVERREVVGGEDRFAAWGDPVVLLECGSAVGDPAEQPAGVNGVTWSVRDIGAGFRWTTTELGVNVAVDVPDAYNGAELVNPLAAPITATLPTSPSPAPGS